MCGTAAGTGSRGGLDSYLGTQGSSEEETSSTGMRTVSPVQPAPETEDEDEGPFAFRRNPACNYHAVSSPITNHDSYFSFLLLVYIVL